MNNINKSIFIGFLLSILLMSIGFDIGESAQEERIYPKLAVYTRGINSMSESQLDTLSWYDKVVMWPASPNDVRRIRERRSDIQLYALWVLQGIVDWNADETWWHADTTRHLHRLIQYYAERNLELGADWFLRTQADTTTSPPTPGEFIWEWRHRAANWTRYCPEGRYGTSKGRTYAQWLVDVAIPQIAANRNSQWGEHWGVESSAYQGVMIEWHRSCPALWNNPLYAYADPKQDGEILGVYSSCAAGGDKDPLSILFKEQDHLFWRGIRHLQVGSREGGELVFLMNGSPFISAPWWQTRMNGIKLEGWLSYYRQEWEDWWGGFYGFRKPNQPVRSPGYKWCEDFLKPWGNDPQSGWGRTILQVMPSFNNPPYAERLKRLGLGTSLLGEGYFAFTYDEKELLWQPEYNWNFGTPLRDYFREIHVSFARVDTLYVREFTKGFVEVNPYRTHAVNGVGHWDSRFGFWQTVEDLHVRNVDSDMVELQFTSPEEILSPIDGIELRYSLYPLSLENWESATLFTGAPLITKPNSITRVRVENLRPGTIYYFALRNVVYGRKDPNPPYVISARTRFSPHRSILPRQR